MPLIGENGSSVIYFRNVIGNGPNMRKPGLKIETKAKFKLSGVFFEKPDAF